MASNLTQQAALIEEHLKKWLIVIAALMPLSGMANMLNNTNQPGYNPNQQRMQIQQQQKRKLQERRDSVRQRVIQSQPGQLNSNSQTQYGN